MPQLTILIADDDEVITATLTTLLQSKGFNTVVAYDAMQTTHEIVRSSPAAIFLDIKMPGGTGFEVLKRIKAEPEQKSIPIVVISSSTDEKLRQQALDLGADLFLQKPLNLEQVYRTLLELLEDRP